MEIDDVLYRHVTHVVRQRFGAEPLKELDVVEGVCHGGRISEGDLRPGQFGGRIEGDDAGEAHAIRQIGELFDRREFGSIRLWLKRKGIFE